MPKIFTQEQQMEERLIELLTKRESQWTYRSDLKTADDLWENFFQQLEANNTAKLDGVPLTSQEKLSIKSQLDFPSFYIAGGWLSGENGVAQVELHREDASLGSCQLTVINGNEIAGGSSHYEVINQFRSEKRDFLDQDGRFDVTLMINGIPLIQIELKNRSEGYKKAFNQIDRYIKTGKYHGIFSMLQMFVVSNGVDTKYIAANTKLNAKFLTGWVDQDNQPVMNLEDFATSVLSIPEAHEMIANYSVLDKSSNSVILLRPYQIHAIKAIRQASYEQKGGYVWHTTGSGKTLTSFKVARNLLKIASIDKTIFIVDRRDLDQQTFNAFASYAEADFVDVDETANVNDLIKRLTSKDRSLVITTIQKLNHVMKRYEQNPDNKRLNKLRDLRLAVVVDECHRAVTPQKQFELEKFFKYSLWYGFTGTPLFAENARDAFGDLARTTEEQYGECLHKYTVQEAMHDQAVLGFQIEYKQTFSDFQLDQLVASQFPKANLDAIDKKEKEAQLDSAIFDHPDHMEAVVDSIINKSQNKFGFNNGVGKTYDAILTTTSIDKAIAYYKLFKEVKAGENQRVSISETTKRAVLDFPKVAITFSISDNENDSQDRKESMKEILTDYNQEFGTNFSLETLNAYNQNLNNRLARKSDTYKVRSEQIDLVIVVDRLLTGFDAPCLSTLFMDRPPMKPHNLIQAFSRTNRLFDDHKKYGQIVTFQTPAIYEEAVKKALILYSNGGEDQIQAPTYEESKEELDEVVKELRALVPNAESFNNYTELAEMKRVAKAFQRFDTIYRTIEVYSDFSEAEFVAQYGFDRKEFEDYTGAYKNLIERIKEEMNDEEEVDEDDSIDIEYEIESVRTEQIDYDYLVLLIDRYRESTEEQDKEKLKHEAEKTIDEFGRRKPELSEKIRDIFQAIISSPDKYKNQSTDEILANEINGYKEQVLEDYAKAEFLDEDLLKYVAANYDEDREGTQIGESEMINTADFEAYKENTENPKSKLQYRKEIRNGYKDLIREKIMPYDV
ncbi:type I restriction endonuclease subunit R [Aerococcus loyolae]|uniref:Type I restriction enzyme endonuclease subunit n=1 Tax=Aerococcus loyolae TaxID=2976809 RepID=A0ABT4BXC7_9LACT|nr:type I restriction endonuclease subunit R [Aerococcus loyolae]MCY3024926.1 type I restriction endonuclease subunit R [Aerococcus loyolae]MCY3027018.1 type I restriction endonuclease subunit R [Aerococcus loyolae]MCY3028602.1 type I restriction endonuclease subunit R [Aerococcus loyolae]OAM70555.1 DEAD/DEAH box helicase [Aerococcus loyolae]